MLRNTFWKIWHGPFHLGPLQRPVSVGDALLKLFEVVWKGFVAVIIAVIGAVLSIAVYLNFLQPKPLDKQIQTLARVDRKLCSDPKFPLLVRFTNNSTKTIGLIDFQVEARRWGTTTDLNNDYVGLKSDTIIPAHEQLAWCYALPENLTGYNPRDLGFTAKINYVNEYDGEMPPVVRDSAPSQ